MWYNHPFSQRNKATKRAVEVQFFMAAGGAGEGKGGVTKLDNGEGSR